MKVFIAMVPNKGFSDCFSATSARDERGTGPRMAHRSGQAVTKALKLATNGNYDTHS